MGDEFIPSARGPLELGRVNCEGLKHLNWCASDQEFNPLLTPYSVRFKCSSSVVLDETFKTLHLPIISRYTPSEYN